MRDTELRAGLADLAEPVTPVADYEVRVLRKARRIRARHRLAGAAVCLALVATVFRLAGPAPQLVATPPDGPFLGWSPAGDVDAALVREATEVWDRGGPHTAVRTLVARRDQHLHSVVVLEGLDDRNAARLAFFTSDTTAADALRLRAERPAPDPASTQVISLISPRLTGPAGAPGDSFWDTYAIALAMPGVTTLRLSTTTVDDELRQDPDHATGRFVVTGLPSATAETTTISGYVRSARMFARWKQVFAVPGDGGATGDARGVRGAVVRRSDRQIVVVVPSTGQVRTGQLAVVAAGLVGRVTAVDLPRGEATIELITSPGFTSPARTSISNVPGSVHGTGGKMLMTGIPAGPKMYVYHGNRVVVPDPAQDDDELGAITIGRATADKPDGADTVELTPTADLTDLTEVSIMTPA